MRAQQALHPVAAQQRQQPPLAAARLVPARHQRRQVGAVVAGTTPAGGVNSGSCAEQLRLERLDGEQRDQADHRAHLAAAHARRRAGAARRSRTRPPRPTGRCRVAADVGHRLGDVQEVLEELGGDVLVDRVVQRQLQGDAHHVQAVHRHPGGAVGLVDDSRRSAAARCGRRRRCCPGRGSRPGRCCGPAASLRLTHQVKLSSSLWKTRSRKARSPLSPRCLRSIWKTRQRRPGVDRRVDVAEGPLVGRQLAVGVHVPLARSSTSCSLANSGSIMRERDAVEGQVPGGVPGVLPLVRHRDDVGVVQVPPVARCGRARRSAGGGGWAGSPSQPLRRRRSGRTACVQIMPANACRCTRRASGSVDPGWRSA